MQKKNKPIEPVSLSGVTYLEKHKYGATRPNGRKHAGIDIKKDEGTKVKTILGGEIIRATDASAHKDYGGLVIIYHGKRRLSGQAPSQDFHLYTLYAHLKEESVKKGQKVDQGHVIGTVGDTGNSDPDDFHLHFEVLMSSSVLKWGTESETWITSGQYRIAPLLILNGTTPVGDKIEYKDKEREVTDADRVKFAEKLRIKEKRNTRGRLVSHDVWVNNKHVGRLDNRTKEIKLSIPMSKFFALVDGPKPMKRHGEADFDVKLNA